MSLDTHRYDLGFVQSQQQSHTPPELVFRCSRTLFPTIQERLTVLRENLSPHATEYFFGKAQYFTVPRPGKVGLPFGYRTCGYITLSDLHAAFHLPLRGGQIRHHLAFTIHLLQIAFDVISSESEAPSNRVQQFELEMCTDNFREHGYGHALGGYLSPTVTAWLANYVAKPETQQYGSGGAPMPEAVVSAMRSTWQAVAGRTLQRFIDNANGVAYPNGSFVLGCFGNACDVGVYPSEFRVDDRSHTLSCHNLDTAEQQLTLLAGLAALCQAARGVETD